MAGLGGRLRVAPVQRLALTPQLRRALDMLRMDATEITRLLEEEAGRNPWLALQRPAGGGGELPPDAEAPAPGLHSHVSDWIETQFRPGPDLEMAYMLTEALEPTGWLGEPLDQIAARNRVSAERLLAVLARVQRIEPAGLFARDLAECLLLQARAEGLLDSAMQALLTRLDLLARGGAEAVARAARLPVAEIAAAAAHLRGFDPKPGLGFGPVVVAASRNPVPELTAQQEPDGTWRAALNPAALPQAVVRAGASPGDAAARAAAELVALLQRRNRTLVSIADAVLAQQGPALDQGRSALRPLTRAAIAEITGMAASTVGRALQGARIVTPHGTMTMAEFFPAPLGADHSSAQAENALRALIAAENPAAPLSDSALAEGLARQGIPTSRRTVAKYRDRMGLPPGHLRRRGTL